MRPRFRSCPMCEQVYPWTEEFFGRSPKRRVWRPVCRDCDRLRRQLQRRAHYLANRERYYENNRNYAEANPDKVAVWKEKHRPKQLARVRAQRRADPEAHRLEVKEWRRRNPEKSNAMGRLKRARKRGAPGAHTADDVSKQHDRQRGCCYWCAVKIVGRYHVDHVVPLSRGGSNGPDNIVVACPSCNSRKYTKLPHEFSERLC